MPSIIPSPGVPGIAPNSGQIYLAEGDNLVVASGQRYYTTSTDTLVFASATAYADVTNFGQLWNIASGDAWGVRAINFGAIANHGLIVAQSNTGTARGVVCYSTWEGLTNTGSIYAIAPSLYANGVEDWSPYTLRNEGLIAAQGALGATAIGRANGGLIENTASGRILAEGAEALAIYMGHAQFGFDHSVADIDNAGLIQAASTSDAASIGILVTAVDFYFTFRNTGSLIADVALYAIDGGSPVRGANVGIFNASSGIIRGDLITASGADIIDNDGLIEGDIDLGDGQDTFDTSVGQYSGGASLGWGNDTFIGGQSASLVFGDRGDDTLTGGAGAELLIGGRGNDVIAGGAGNDGLYGDYGDDIITVSGGDRVNGGGGADTIHLTGFVFADIDGGAGADVLVLPNTALVLDLQAAIASGRLHGIEHINLPGAQGLVVRSGDVGALSGGQLIVSGGASASLYLVGAWSQQADAVVGGVTYERFELNGATVLVSPAADVSIEAAAPGGAVGLDAIAGGPQALLPGVHPGIDLTPDVVNLGANSLLAPQVIEAPEQYIMTGAGNLYSDESVVSYGTITRTRVSTDTNSTSSGIMVYNANFTNHGEVSVTIDGPYPEQLAANLQHYAIYGADQGLMTYGGANGALASNIFNHGNIFAWSEMGTATGVYAEGGRVENYDTITALSDDFAAFGVNFMNGGTVVNTGTISATGAVVAFAIVADSHPLTLNNSGTIVANADPGGEEVAIALFHSLGTHTIVNSGEITAEIAIRTKQMVNGGGLHLTNTGLINGRIELNIQPNGVFGRQDTIINSGTINGDVLLGAEADLYDGRTGVLQGTVFGQTGADVLWGGASADALNGGADADQLSGGDGADALLGEAGNDVLQGDAQNDTLSGGDGDDQLNGGLGADAINGGDGFDTVRYDGASAGVTIYVDAPHANTGEAAGDTLASIEGFVGSTFNDYMVGGAANNVLQGFGGTDILEGHGGDDSLDGGDGDDALQGGLGGDILNGGNGFDTARYDGAVAGVTIYVDAAYANLGEAAGDFHISIEGIVGSTFGDYLVGGTANNILQGFSGHDILEGHDGNDLLDGGDGNDQMNGGLGGDIFDGGAGFDTVRYDGATAGVVAFMSDAWANTGEAAGDAYLSVEALYGSNFNDTLAGASNANELQGFDGTDFIYGYAGGDFIGGGAGDDFLDGGADADGLQGGAGADQFVFRANEAEGDSVVDFDGASGDNLLFIGYGTAAAGATFTQLNATQWQITSADGLITDIITLANGATVDPSDYAFG